jgi:hypothetical protein
LPPFISFSISYPEPDFAARDCMVTGTLRRAAIPVSRLGEQQ